MTVPYLLLFFAFLAGMVTILAPCIWPVLPIVLSSSIAGEKGHKRPLGITLGVMLSFTFFTLSISTLVHVFHLDPNILRIFAVVLIGFFGLTMVIPSLATKFETFVSRFSNIFGQNSTSSKGSGFLPGFITGLSLGIVWSPCAGPILATIATLAATGKVTLSVILITLSYVTGVGVPLFAVAFGGQWFITRTRGVNKYTGRIQQVFGIVMILAALAIFTNYDQTFQLKLLQMFPQLGQAVNGFESSGFVQNQLNLLNGSAGNTSSSSDLFNQNPPYSAPELTGIAGWLNTPAPVSLHALKGKVVLVDFWTYTCINCIRTLPHVTAWYEKYKNYGFTVIGVHTPEFQFEHDKGNVADAIKRFQIHYPVAQDNDYATWTAFNNQYWPAEYLIDARGMVRRHAFGEGEYDKTELAIQTLLQEAGYKVPGSMVQMPDQTPTNQNISPETYLGTKRMQYYAQGGSVSAGQQTFSDSQLPGKNMFSFGGSWNITDEYVQSTPHATLLYNFTASKVYIIFRPQSSQQTGKVKVYLDGAVVSQSQSGKDVQDGIITVDTDRLYSIIDLKTATENHTLKLEFLTPGIKAFTFTFG